MIETNRVGFRKQLTGPYPHSNRLKPCMLVFFACCLLWPLSGTFVILTATASAADSPQVSETATSVRYSLPEDVLRRPFSFAGEIVPFQRSDVRYRVGSEINFLLLDARSVLIEWLIRRDVPVQLIQQILEKEGVPPEFVFFYPVLAGLTRNDQKVSGAGIWHISKPCDKADGLEMQEDSWHDDRMDIELATHCFASRIKSLRSQIRGGSWIMAAAAYVTSPNTVSDAQGNWDATSFWDVPLPPNIEQLICRWIAFTIIHGHERFYHINIPRQTPLVLDKVTGLELSRDVSVAELAVMLGIPSREVLKLNPKLKSSVGTFPSLSGTMRLAHNINVPKGKGALLVEKLKASGHLTAQSKRTQ